MAVYQFNLITKWIWVRFAGIFILGVWGNWIWLPKNILLELHYKINKLHYLFVQEINLKVGYIYFHERWFFIFIFKDLTVILCIVDRNAPVFLSSLNNRLMGSCWLTDIYYEQLFNIYVEIRNVQLSFMLNMSIT